MKTENKKQKKQATEEVHDGLPPVEESLEEKLEEELALQKDKYLRLYSEFENFRRRTAKEKLELIDTAGEKIMVELLPVLDDFKRAEQSLDSDDVKAIAEGVRLIAEKLNKTLQAQGLKRMSTEPGTEFDTELHEAITQMPVEDEKLKGKIIDTIEDGYFLGDKVIRHAKVVIGA